MTAPADAPPSYGPARMRSMRHCFDKLNFDLHSRKREDRKHKTALDHMRPQLAIKSMGGERTGAWRTVLDDLIQRGLRRVSPHCAASAAP